MENTCKPDSTNKKLRRKKYQLVIGIILLAVITIIYFLISGFLPDGGILSLMWIFGIAFGFVLQRSRFCFTASFRDPCLVKETNLSKAVIIALGLSSIGIIAFQYYKTVEAGGFLQIENLPGSISPAGVHTAIGGIMFGVGMVIAGGCASGTLMRIGEGFMMNMITLVFFITGSVLATNHYPLWSRLLMYDPANRIYLPKLLGGWLPALVMHFGMLIILYILADWYGKEKKDETIR